MSIRHVLKTVAATSAATVCAAVFALGVGSGVAGANTLTSGDGNTNLTTVGTVASGTPYDSGQYINVTTIANSTLNNANLPTADQGGNFYLEECADPGGTTGTLPTNSTECEAATLLTVNKNPDGSFTLPFQVYDLPDPNFSGNLVGKCDVAPHQCVIGIFAANPGAPGTFSAPKLFSAPFQVRFTDGTDAGNNPGDGTPEVPLALGLPLAAIAVFGGWTLRNRRRRQQAA